MDCYLPCQTVERPATDDKQKSSWDSILVAWKFCFSPLGPWQGNSLSRWSHPWHSITWILATTDKHLQLRHLSILPNLHVSVHTWIAGWHFKLKKAHTLSYSMRTAPQSAFPSLLINSIPSIPRGNHKSIRLLSTSHSTCEEYHMLAPCLPSTTLTHAWIAGSPLCPSPVSLLTVYSNSSGQSEF